MGNGRDTAVRAGKWTSGPIPFGYVCDSDGYLAISNIPVPDTGMTEGQIAREIFERMARGGREGTTVAVARWLNAVPVPTTARYRNGRTVARQAREWTPARINQMIRRTTYSGRDVFQSSQGHIERDVPALVSPELQARAIATLENNLTLPSRYSRVNILRGVLRCGLCGNLYGGWLNPRGKRGVMPSYRCNAQASKQSAGGGPRCRGKVLHAEALERDVLAFVRELYLNPGPMLAKAQAALRERSGQAAGLEARREAITRRLVELDAVRERVLSLYTRGKITDAEADRTLDETGAQAGTLRAELDTIRARMALAEAAETRLTDAAVLIQKAGQNFDNLTHEQQGEAIRRLVQEITVETVELDQKRGHHSKEARLWAHVLWGDPENVPMTDSERQEYYTGTRGTWEVDGGGAMMLQAIHTVDVMLWYLGDARSVTARWGTFTHQMESEDTALALVTFESGALATIVGTTTFHNTRPAGQYGGGSMTRVELGGERGSFILANDQIAMWKSPEADEPPSGASPVRNAFQDVARWVQDDGYTSPTLVTGDEARKSVELIQAIYESARTGTTVTLR
jgi:site-specific DNA recombinase